MEIPQGVQFILPSWVPNFAARLDIVPITKIPENLRQRAIKLYDKRSVPSNKETLTSVYQPLGDIPSRSYIENSTLCVSGVYIDVLKDMLVNTGANLEAIRAGAAEKGRKWALEAKHKYFTDESIADAIRRIEVLDLVYDDLGRPSKRGNQLDGAFLRKPRAELSLTEYRYQMNMRDASRKASTSRTLGLSQKLYLLKIPNTAVVGNMIWALAGGQVSYILRPINRDLNQYTFIGECYAHGLMDGDVVRRLKTGEMRMEDIYLI